VPARVWRDAFDGLLTAEPPLDTGRISAPTLIVWGARGSLLARAGQEAMAAEIHGARLVIYSDVGHLPVIEAPERVAADLTALCDAARGAVPGVVRRDGERCGRRADCRSGHGLAVWIGSVLPVAGRLTGPSGGRCDCAPHGDHLAGLQVAAAAAAIAFTSFAVRLAFPLGSEQFHLQLAAFPQYVILFSPGWPPDGADGWRR
jgi:hypothetical protein